LINDYKDIKKNADDKLIDARGMKQVGIKKMVN